MSAIEDGATDWLTHLTDGATDLTVGQLIGIGASLLLIWLLIETAGAWANAALRSRSQRAARR
ncbi:hypothetical protein, partial [Moorena sp. SIO1F2]|uniref:hypothetical protein n=1 Tax=Moorena sp. SIO1F2 TaxID=2607819 RepID=UPI0025EFA64F